MQQQQQPQLGGGSSGGGQSRTPFDRCDSMIDSPYEGLSSMPVTPRNSNGAQLLSAGGPGPHNRMQHQPRRSNSITAVERPSPRASVNPPPQHQNGWPYLLSSSQTKPPPGHPHSRPNSRQENERGGGAGGCTAAAEGPLRRRARAASSCQVGLQRTCTACAPLVATTVI
ncbi:MAG: hypothetical protein WDW36_000762 [Sanguina aurantia]